MLPAYRNNTAGAQLLEDAAWLDANWMWVSAVLGAINLIFLFIYLQQTKCFKHKGTKLFTNFTKQHWYGLLLSSVYALHQFEEHGYDIYGRRYMFVPIFNEQIKSLLGIAVTVRATMYINLITIWFSFPVCTYLSTPQNMYMPAAISWGTAVINGLTGHLLPVFNNEYVPGAVQSAFMVPFGMYLLFRVYGGNGLTVGVVIPLIGGVLFHLIALIAPVKISTESSEDYIVPLFQILGGIVLPLVITLLTKKIVQLYTRMYVVVNS